MAEAAQPVESDNRDSQDYTASRKRKGTDDNSLRKTKRSRYIPIACHECKRRKIRCNGRDVCERCSNLSLDCIYAPRFSAAEFKDTEDWVLMTGQIKSLQCQVETLFHALCSLRHDAGLRYDSSLFRTDEPSSKMVEEPQTQTLRSPPNQLHSKSASKTPHFQGPTSSAFGFGVAKTSLQNMGIAGSNINLYQSTVTPDVTAPGSPLLLPPILQLRRASVHSISKAEAVRLCRVFEEEMGIMYPIVDIEALIQHACLLYESFDISSRRTSGCGGRGHALSSEDVESDILKIVMSIALVTENGGKSDLAKNLFDTVCAKDRTRIPGRVDLNTVVILSLKAMYHFHKDDEGMAWRVIGLTARICIELGLHRSDTYHEKYPNLIDRMAAIKVFWSVYVLDRRWSFGTGMPFAMQDADIESNVPKPNEATPYLNAMIDYSQICSRAWSSVSLKEASADPGGALSSAFREQARYLEFQIVEWQRELPPSLSYTNTTSPSVNVEAGGRALFRLRVILYLRANQMRILIYRPVLYSVTSSLSTENNNYAQSVVDVAKDTIRVLSQLNRTSDIYRAQQVCFNHFLVSALAVIFLAASHAPAKFGGQCRDEFYMALDLVRELSADSHVGKRLWKTIRGLKDVGPQLGLHAQGSDRMHAFANHDLQQSAAMAMVGLAGQWVDESSFNDRSNVVDQDTNASPNGMANDLTALFEALGGYGDHEGLN